jgi:hypothetical protein
MRYDLIALGCFSLAAATVLGAPPTPSELAARTPVDAQVVVGMDTAALRAHPLVQSWLRAHQQSWANVDSDGREFLREAGLDPVRDVDAMVLSVRERTPSPRWLVFFAGRYDPVSLAAALAKRGAEGVRDGDTTVYRIHAENGRGDAVLHLSQDVVTIGDSQSVHDSLAGRFKGSSLLGEEVAARHVDTGSEFWMVAVIPDAARTAASGTAGTNGDRERESTPGVILASTAVKRITAQANISENLVFRVWAVIDTAENAGLIRDTVKGALAAMRLRAQDRSPQLVDALRRIDVSVEGSEVETSGSLPLSAVEDVLLMRHESAPQRD